MLVVNDLHAGYGLSEVLDGVSLEVKQGTVVALIGANGAGKTTTMRVISGLLAPSAGEVRLEGRPVQGLGAAGIARLGLAHSPEGRKVFAPLSTEDNLLLGAFRRLPRFFGYRRRAAQDLDRVYALFPRLSERSRQLAGSLSGGEQQLCAIGRALMSEPSLLMLDEPSLGLAPVLVDQVMRTVAELHAGGITVLLVEQNLRKALEISERGTVIETGRVRLEGTSAELAANPEIRAAYLGV